MDCSYCPFSYKNLTTKREKDFNIQQSTIESLFASPLFADSSFHDLIIYGGEALLYFEQIQKVVVKYKKYRKNEGG